MNVAFYVEAGQQTGYGHIVRSLALADELKKRGCHCLFVSNEEGVDRASRAGYDVMTGGAPRVDAWIVDLEGGCPPSLAEQLRLLCRTLVILNGVGYPDGDPGRLLADLVFYQGVTERPYRLDWTGYVGEWYEGPEWLILRANFRRRWVIDLRIGNRVVIAGGGSDPADVTREAIEALEDTRLFLTVVVGPANSRKYGAPGTMLFKDPERIDEIFAGSDVALVSYGMTAFECLALGVPVVALSISPDHAASADLVQERSGGALVSLGQVEGVGPKRIREAVFTQLANWEELSTCARRFVDGRGAMRVADRIMEALG